MVTDCLFTWSSIVMAIVGSLCGASWTFATCVSTRPSARSVDSSSCHARESCVTIVEKTRVAVEKNKDVVPKKSYDETTLLAGDRVEVVTFVGGG